MADENEEIKEGAEATPEAKAEVKTEATPEAKPEDKPAAAADDKPKEAKSEDKPEAAAEEKPKSDADTSKSEAEAALSAGTEQAPAKPVRTSSRSRGASSGVAHVTATFNNTLVTITDMKGAVVAWSTSGKAGFKGSRKSTAFAATMVGQDAARQAVSKGMQEVEVRIQGPGAGRESAVRAFQSAGLNVSVIRDVTPMPHNGCRPRKKRRV